MKEGDGEYYFVFAKLKEKMKIPEIYEKAKRPIISFEVFPPKTDKGMDNLRNELEILISLKPDYMTVTFGAMGTAQTRTLEIATMLKKDYQLPVAHHLTCVGATRAQMEDRVKEIHAAGIENIVALRGDIPPGEKMVSPPDDGLAHGNELVALIRKLEKENGWPSKGIAVAGYPEKHVEAASLDEDLEFLKKKLGAGADFVITQLFYDNAVYFRFLELARERGIDATIVPGLLPILSVSQVRRITSICGAKIPPKFNQSLEIAIDDPEMAKSIGVGHCAEQVMGLLEKGAPGIHFYVLNKSSHIKAILEKIPPALLKRD